MYDGHDENIIPEEKQNEIEEVITPQKKTYLSYIIIAINAIIWFITYYYGSNGNFVFGEKFNPLIMQGEYWRLIMPIFLHGGIAHLAINSYSIYAIGPTVEMIYGKRKFLLIYMSAGILGNVASFVFSINPSVGASGAIFGLLGALFYMLIRNRKAFKSSFGMSIIFITVINIVYGFSNAGIDNYAHIGGLIGGFLAALGTGFLWERGVYLKRFFVWVLLLALIFGGTYVGFHVEQNINLNVNYQVSGLLDKASSSFNKNNYATAEEFASQAEKLGSKDNNLLSGIYDIMSASSINQDKLQQGKKYAQKLIPLNPGRGHYLLGFSFYKTGDKTHTIIELKKALELDPTNTQIKGILKELGQ